MAGGGLDETLKTEIFRTNIFKYDLNYVYSRNWKKSRRNNYCISNYSLDYSKMT